MEKSSSARTMPAWLSATIIVAAILGAAWLVRWFIHSGPLASEVVVLDRGPEDGIRTLTSDRSWRIQSGNNGLRIVREPGGGMNMTFYFIHYDFLTPAEFETLNDGRRIANDSAVSAELNLSEKQTTDLREQVQRGFNLEIAEADRKRLFDAFSAWLAASGSSREDRETAVLHALDDVGNRSASSAHHVTVDAAARIKSTLNEEQWKKFAQM